MAKDNFDVVVIGGGPGGYVAAIRAAQLGLTVACVESRGALGGTCLNVGCIPSKALLQSSHHFEVAGHEFAHHGIKTTGLTLDLKTMMGRKDKVVQELTRGIEFLMKKNKIDYVVGEGRITGPGEVAVKPSGKGAQKAKKKQLLKTENIIIATGSVVTRFPIPGIDEAGYLTSDDVLELREQPQSLIVFGAGPVAVELAQFYQRLHTQVTMIQRSDHILSAGDEDLAQPLQDRLRAEGMQVFTGTRLNKVTHAGAMKTVHFTHGGKEKTVAAEALLMALGRRPNIDGLDLATAGVDTDGRVLTVDAAMRTSQPHIFAVGDVNGRHEIVHIAIQQGEKT